MDRELYEKEVDTALSRAAAGIAPPAALLLSILWGALAVGHNFTLDAGPREILTGLAIATAFASGLVAWQWPRSGGPHRAHLAVGALALMAWMNTVAHLWLVPEARNATNFAALLLALGLLVTVRRWFYPLLALTLVSWLGITEAIAIVDAYHWHWHVTFAATIAVIAHEQRRRMVGQAILRERMLRAHADVLQELTHAPELNDDTPDAMFDRLLKAGAETLRVSRAGIWLFDQIDDAIEAEALFDELGPGAEGLAKRIERDQASAYFEALETERTIAVADVHIHAATRDLDDVYLTPLGVDAILDSPILVNGRLVGVLCLEHRGGDRHWSLEEQSFAASLAGLAALGIQAEERARLERRTQTAERLESLGLLAGGVAHDFNNLLTAVLGNAELAASQLGTEHPLREDIDGIINAASRAADLARQMLTYSGRAAFVTQAVDVNAIARDLVAGWSRNNPAARPTHLDLGEDMPLADADPIQVVQILLNLLGNASEAGAENIHVRTGRVHLDADDLLHCVISDGLDPGDYVYIEAEDDGEGMDAETAGRIFEPFFTTKRLGHGLGLAAALGMMRVHRGTIELDTVPGRGTRFRFMFRISEGVERIAVPVAASERLMQAPLEAGNILVVEDEPLVRSLLGNFLKKAGHRMDAISDCADLDRRLDVMQLHTFNAAMVDLTLPDGDGIDVVRQLRQKRADLPVVVMSGYDGTQALARLGNTDRVEFLSKPFTKRQLLDCLEHVTA